jgi:glycosyltransferase involved in cell wall biosynthesis
MTIIYRISDAGYNKVKPEYINNENCLKNALDTFKDCNWHIIADNCSIDTTQMICKYIEEDKIHHVSVGHGAGTFNLALDYALTLPDDEIVYFLENDYLHKKDSNIIIKEGIKLGANFITLYDHPDKYIPGNLGGNPYVDVDGGETTKLYISKSCHWKITNSTTMTFACSVKTLKNSESILRKHTSGSHPNDFHMFLELQEKGFILISSVPGYSTHGETQWLSPLTNWEEFSKF